MEERRIERVCEAMRLSAEAERKVLPVVSRCLDAMMDAAESIQPRMVSRNWLTPDWQNQTILAGVSFSVLAQRYASPFSAQYGTRTIVFE